MISSWRNEWVSDVVECLDVKFVCELIWLYSSPHFIIFFGLEINVCWSEWQKKANDTQNKWEPISTEWAKEKLVRKVAYKNQFDSISNLRVCKSPDSTWNISLIIIKNTRKNHSSVGISLSLFLSFSIYLPSIKDEGRFFGRRDNDDEGEQTQRLARMEGKDKIIY